MKFLLPYKILLAIVVSYFFYSYTIYTQKMDTEKAKKTISPLALEGKKVFQKYNCVSCHQMYGLGGYLGPDLTNTISEKGEVYARTILKYGTAKMPNFHLNDHEITSLIDLLKEVDSSGTFPVKNFDITWFGTIKEK